ncbi:hypothetical protein [Paucimonas lemoignei]|nr:hypothetical protein [Paucimonas lemoignei]
MCAVAIGYWQATGAVPFREAGPAKLLEATQQTSSPHADPALPSMPKIATSAADAAGSATEVPGEQMAAIVVSGVEDGKVALTISAQESPAPKLPSPLQVNEEKGNAVMQPAVAAQSEAENKGKAGEALGTASSAMRSSGSSPVLPVNEPAPAQQSPVASKDAQVVDKNLSAVKKDKSGSSIANAPRQSMAKGKSAEKDGDVELIAALLNRVSAKSDPVAEDAARKQASAKSASRSGAADQKKAKKNGLVRESATPSQASVEAQLKRCGTMGFLDSELCRIRVCDGRWGREPGCPENSQASAALP